MKIRILSLITLTSLLALATTGCALLSGEEKPVEQTQEQKEQISFHEASQANGEKLIAAFISDQSGDFTALLPADLQKQFGSQEFTAARKSIQETLGKPVSAQYALKLDHPVLDVSIWVVTFERVNTDKQTVTQQSLFRVISGKLDGKSQIVSFNFF